MTNFELFMWVLTSIIEILISTPLGVKCMGYSLSTGKGVDNVVCVLVYTNMYFNNVLINNCCKQTKYDVALFFIAQLY